MGDTIKISVGDLKLEYLTERNTNFFSFYLRNDDLTLLHGNVYKYERSMKNGIKIIKKNITDPDKYIIRKKTFSLRAGNNREIGRSPEMDPEQLKLAMAALQKYGADAPIVKGY